MIHYKSIDIAPISSEIKYTEVRGGRGCSYTGKQQVSEERFRSAMNLMPQIKCQRRFPTDIGSFQNLTVFIAQIENARINRVWPRIK